jgi:sec-independent protein translocase protein TatB
MEIFGIGTSELLFIIIIALIILGPKDMQKAGKTIGKWMRDIVTSDGWKIFQQTSRELRTLPNRLMRDANTKLNQIGKDLNKAVSPPKKENGPSSWVNKPITPNIPPRSQPMPDTPIPAVTAPENTIEPPAPTETKTNESDQEKDA